MAVTKRKSSRFEHTKNSNLNRNKNVAVGISASGSGNGAAQLAASRPIQNRLLAALAPEEYQRLLPDLLPVHLKKGAVLYHAGAEVTDCYFPQGGVLSFLSADGDERAVQVAMIDSEGMAGIAAVLQSDITPYEVRAQFSSNALRIEAAAVTREFRRCGRLQTFLLRYAHSLLCQISQSAVCNRFHTVERRLCRWLLTASDKVKSNRIALTQEDLSFMLGTPRTNVSMIASPLQQAGLIDYARGRITITDRQGLAEATCECYETVKKYSAGFYQ